MVNCLQYKWRLSCNLRFITYPILVLVGEPDAKEPSAWTAKELKSRFLTGYNQLYNSKSLTNIPR